MLLFTTQIPRPQDLTSIHVFLCCGLEAMTAIPHCRSAVPNMAIATPELVMSWGRMKTGLVFSDYLSPPEKKFIC
jgi:hypothetical protein